MFKIMNYFFFFFFQAEDGIRDVAVTGVQTCALPIFNEPQLDEPPVGVLSILLDIDLRPLALLDDRPHRRENGQGDHQENRQLERAEKLAEGVAEFLETERFRVVGWFRNGIHGVRGLRVDRSHPNPTGRTPGLSRFLLDNRGLPSLPSRPNPSRRGLKLSWHQTTMRDSEA